MKLPFLSKQQPEKATQHVEGTNTGVAPGIPNGAQEWDHTPLPRLTMRLVFLALLVSMGGFIFGYDTGQISGFQSMPDFLQRFGQYNTQTQAYYFSNVRTGLIVGLLSIGTLIGALVAAPIADLIGRKYSIAWWCVVFHVGNIVQIAAGSGKWYEVMMGRWVLGLAVGALSLLVPMYMAETAPPHTRGALICCYQLFITLGIFVAACINFGTVNDYSNTAQWRIPMGIGFLWALILGVGILVFPETPRYAYRKGRVEEARNTMTKFYGVSHNNWAVQNEMQEIQAKLDAEQGTPSGARGFFEMFTAPRMFYRIALGMTLQMFQQLTGANYFFYYGTLIFKGVQISSFVTQMILNGINFGVTFYGLYIVEKYGRRKSLIAGSTWMFICFLIFASVGHFALDQADPTNTPSASIALIVFACFFIFGYATTWGPMVWAIVGELYPSKYRARSMALATASNWLWNFLIAFFTSFITDAIDFRYGYVFAACNFMGGCIVYFFVIEGRGRTLEELDTMYIDKVKPWESSKWQAPEAEELRRRSLAAWGQRDEEGVIRGDEEEKKSDSISGVRA